MFFSFEKKRRTASSASVWVPTNSSLTAKSRIIVNHENNDDFFALVSLLTESFIIVKDGDIAVLLLSQKFEKFQEIAADRANHSDEPQRKPSKVSTMLSLNKFLVKKKAKVIFPVRSPNGVQF